MIVLFRVLHDAPLHRTASRILSNRGKMSRGRQPSREDLGRRLSQIPGFRFCNLRSGFMRRGRPAASCTASCPILEAP